MQEIIFMEGNVIRRLKGEIIDQDGDFVRIKTEFRIFQINKNVIIKIEEEKT